MFTTSSLMLHRYMLYSASASFLSSECFIDVTQRPQGSDCVVIWVQVQGWIGERVHVKFCWGKDSGVGGGCSVHVCVCVWKAGVDTDTAAPLYSPISSQSVWGTPHRLARSNLCWNQKPAAGRPQPRGLCQHRDKRGTSQGESLGWLLLKIMEKSITDCSWAALNLQTVK